MTKQRSPWPVCLAALAALTLAPAAGRGADEPDPEPQGKWPATTAADRVRSAKNIKQIAIAFHSFCDSYGAMPAAAICDARGKPLLSWRVALLPWLEQGALYKEFKLDEPWDSKHNKKLLARMPKIYAPPIAGKPRKPNATYYQVFTGTDTPFNPNVVHGRPPFTLGARFPASFTDGTSNTILVVEAGEAVPWTKPADVAYDRKKPPKLGGLFPEGFHFAMADGSFRFVGRTIDRDTLHALITPNGGEVIDWTKVPAPTRARGRK